MSSAAPPPADPPVANPIEPGSRVGKYVLEHRLGRGGMAEVWAASVEGPGGFTKPVAVKFMLDPLTAQTEYHRLFFNEASVAAELHHSNLVSIFDFDQAAESASPALRGRYYIVMERVEGVDLYRFLCRLGQMDRPCPVDIALYVTGEILKGLSYIHERRRNSVAIQMVHRDVSPQNVLVAYSGEVKVSDFGIAKAGGRGQTTQGIRCKLSYCAPELLNGVAPSHLSDQFAVGVILWEMLTGRTLFDGQFQGQILNKVQRCEVPPVGRVIPPEMDLLMRRMLAADHYARFPSTNDALTAVFQTPGYKADPRPLGQLLAFLVPDPHQRWIAQESLPHSLRSDNNVLLSAVPRPPAPSPMVAIDWSDGSAVPVLPRDIGQAPFSSLSPESWVEWWQSRGRDRGSEVFSPGQTMIVPTRRRS